MYQDNISAMLGAGQDPKEQQLAQALRGQQAGGDMLGLSTIGQVSQMGQNINKRTNAAAKQAGSLKQAREKAELDREQRAATQGATNDYRASMLSQSQERIAAQAENNRLINEDRLRKADAAEVKQNDLNIQRGITNEIKEKKINIKSRANNHVLNNLSGLIGQNAMVLRANLEAGIEAPEDPNAPPPEVRAAEWAASNGDDEVFNAQVTKDIGDLSTMVKLPMTDAVIGGGDEAYKWGKLVYDITGGADGGRTGIIPFTQKGKSVPTRAMKVYDDSSKALSSMITQMDGYEPSFSNTGNTPFVNPVLNYMSTSQGVELDGDGRKTEAAWWGNLNQFYTMPERHEMFGSALTPTEEASWKASAINANMDDYQIRHAMATRLHIMRTFSERKIASGLAEGYSQETLRSKYKFLTDTTAGVENPDSPEGERLLRAGWYPGDDPADFAAEAQENYPAETNAPTTRSVADIDAEIAALKAGVN